MATMTPVRPSTRMYTPPAGTYDQPFTWIFDASTLTDGSTSLGNLVYIKAGYGDFVCRRIVGISSVVNPEGGQYQIYDRYLRPIESAPTFATAQGTDDIMLPDSLDYPETSSIRFDLYDILRDPPQINPAQISSIDAPAFYPYVPSAVFQSPTTGYLYALLQDLTGFPYSGLMHMYQSTNGGQTWTLVDSAGGPIIQWRDTVLAAQGATGVIVGDTIYCFYTTDASTPILTVMPFNTQTNTWGAAIPSGLTFETVPGGDSDLTNVMTAQANNSGQIAVFAQATGVTQAPSDYLGLLNLAYFNTATQTFSANWTLLVPASTTAWTGICIASCCDENNVIHVFGFLGGTGTLVYMINIHSDGSISQPSATAIAVDGAANVYTQAVILNGQIFIAWFYGTDNKYHISISSDLTDAPSWTNETITGVEITSDDQPCALNVQYGSLVFSNIVNSLNPTSTLQTLISQNGMSWTAPTLTPFTSDTGDNVYQAIPINSLGYLVSLGAGGTGFLPYAFLSVIRAQIAFQGVRRQPGPMPQLAPACAFEPRVFSYTAQITIDQAGPAQSPTASIFQTVNDYDFELDAVIITYSSAAPLPVGKAITEVLLYDAVKNITSNIPMLDVFFNGAPGSPYEDGALVPPLLYPAQTQIRLDVYSMIESVYLPVTMNVEFRGRQRYPCTTC